MPVAFELRHRRVAPVGQNLVGRSRGNDQPVPDGNRSVGDHVHLVLERAGAGAAAVTDESERGRAHHVQVSAGHCGITAITSISMSHSGCASPLTTSPVETGWTPRSQRPTVWYTGSR